VPGAGTIRVIVETSNGSVRRSLQEYGRGIAGGLLFSLPLLYTMEIWQFGFILSPTRIFIYAVATFVLLLGYNRFAGLHVDATWWEVSIDSVEEMGIGAVLSTFFLFLMGRITLDMALPEVVGRTVVAGMTVAIGVSVGTAQLGGSAGDEENKRPSAFHEQLVIAFIAAILVAGSIAPTDEVALLGMYLSFWNLIAVGAVSLLLTAFILFYANFIGAARHVPERLTLSIIVSRSLSSYAVALFVSALMLWFFGRFEDASAVQAFSATISLGLVATLGASAGRLLLQ
jgi:putative integral membrane protein (TIGR02587 family)